MGALLEVLIWLAYAVSLYFSVFLLLVYIDKRDFFNSEKSSTKLSRMPMVSILVPAYNEENTILKTMQSIAALDYPIEKIDTIIINDGSRDKTLQIVKEFIKDKPQFSLISHDNMGKAASLNKALKQAKGEFFACLDADSFVDSLTLRKMLAFYEKENDENLAIVTPAMKVAAPRRILQKVQWLEYLVIILVARLTSHLDSLYVAPGPFSVYRTSIIREVGGFDEKSITEDQEIAYRMQKNDYKIKQCFDGYVYTTAPGKLKPFYKQRRRWYLGGLLCLEKYKDMVANRKYGDFGVMQMVKNVAGYFLAVTGLAATFYLILLPAFQWLKNLISIKFDVTYYAKVIDFNLQPLDFLLADFRKIFIVIFLFAIGLCFFYLAHKNANEKIRKFGWLPIIPYFAFYYILKGTILLMTFANYSRRKKIKW